MSDTHFNAMRMEADELEKDANAKLAQAKQLRDQANELDPNYTPPKKGESSDANGNSPQLARSGKSTDAKPNWDEKASGDTAQQ